MDRCALVGEALRLLFGVARDHHQRAALLLERAADHAPDARDGLVVDRAELGAGGGAEDLRIEGLLGQRGHAVRDAHERHARVAQLPALVSEEVDDEQVLPAPVVVSGDAREAVHEDRVAEERGARRRHLQRLAGPHRLAERHRVAQLEERLDGWMIEARDDHAPAGVTPFVAERRDLVDLVEQAGEALRVLGGGARGDHHPASGGAEHVLGIAAPVLERGLARARPAQHARGLEQQGPGDALEEAPAPRAAVHRRAARELRLAVELGGVEPDDRGDMDVPDAHCAARERSRPVIAVDRGERPLHRALVLGAHEREVDGDPPPRSREGALGEIVHRLDEALGRAPRRHAVRPADPIELLHREERVHLRCHHRVDAHSVRLGAVPPRPAI